MTLFGDEHVQRYEQTDGAEGYDWLNGTTILIVTTKGRKSGETRKHALIYRDWKDDYLIVASKGVDDAVPGLVDLVTGDRLDLRADAVLGAEVQHLLGLADTADHRAGPPAAHRDQRERRHLERLGRRAHADERSVAAQQRQVLLHRQRRRHRIHDQVEGAGQRLERRAVAGRVVVVGAQALAVVLLGQRLRQHRDLGAHGAGD